MDPLDTPTTRELGDALLACLTPIFYGSRPPPSFESERIANAVYPLTKGDGDVSPNSPLYWLPGIARSWVVGLSRLISDWPGLDGAERDARRNALLYGPGGRYSETAQDLLGQFMERLGTPVLSTEAQQLYETIAGSYLGMWFDAWNKWYAVKASDRDQICRSLVAAGLIDEDQARASMDDAKRVPKTPFPKMHRAVAFDSAPARRKKPNYVEGQILATTLALIFRDPANPSAPVVELPYSEIKDWRMTRAGTGLILRRLRIVREDNAHLELQLGKRAAANVAAILQSLHRA